MRRLCACLVASALALAGAGAAGTRPHGVRVTVLQPRALRGTVLLLPDGYGPDRHPRIAVVLAPHAASRTAHDVARTWGALVARGGFAVLSPVARPPRPRSIRALAQARRQAERELPWLRLDATRVYGFGSGRIARSLLLVAARYPWSLAGVAAASPAFTIPRRTTQARRPEAVLSQLAFARVPLQLWSPGGDSALYRALKQVNRRAPVLQAAGSWGAGRLPVALLGFGLLQPPGALARVAAAPAFLGSTKPLSSLAGGSTRFPGASSCRSEPGPLSYGWPIAPFDQPHPVRGSFGDPRTRYRLSSPDDPGAVGSFSFHNGVDISAPPDTPVYPVVSGVVEAVWSTEVDVRTPDGRLFRYEHITPSVGAGDPAAKDETILGAVVRSAKHVHLSESRDGRITNPLAPGHLTPWTDDTTPEVSEILLRDEAGNPIDPQRLAGRIRIDATAYDSPPLPVPGRWYGMPLAPALVTWQLTAADGTAAIPERVAADFRHEIPDQEYFWSVYARGTYQNFPAIGLHYFARTPGRFLFDLTPRPLDTLLVPAGDYTLTVDASDLCGNVGALTKRVRILPQPGQVQPAPPPKPEAVAAPRPHPQPQPHRQAQPQAQARPVAAPRATQVLAWPRGRSGFTVVLASIPRVEGARAAMHEARAALERGAPAVGLLDARRFPGLNHRFRVVFSGVYADAGAAQAAASDVSGAYPGAYVRQVAAPLGRWPVARSGWTVVLASVAAGPGAQAEARRKATEASAAGLARVGVLSTDDFATLNPGYLVVYSGVYSTEARALAAAAAARGRFPDAYQRWIGPRG